MEPVVSTRSTSAPGTMAPVGSATTPCTEGVAGGAAGLEGLQAKATPGAARTRMAAAERKKKAEKRMMRYLQGKTKRETELRTSEAGCRYFALRFCINFYRAEGGCPVGGGIDEHVGGDGFEAAGGEAKGAANAPGAGVTGGLHVDLAVTDHHGLLGARIGFLHEGEEAFGVGLFGCEAVAAVNIEEVGCEAEGFADGARGTDGFVGEDGHGAVRRGGLGIRLGHRLGFGFIVDSAQGGEGFENAFVGVGVVELVFAIVVEKEGVALGEGFFAGVEAVVGGEG